MVEYWYIPLYTIYIIVIYILDIYYHTYIIIIGIYTIHKSWVNRKGQGTLSLKSSHPYAYTLLIKNLFIPTAQLSEFPNYSYWKLLFKEISRNLEISRNKTESLTLSFVQYSNISFVLKI